MKVLSVVASPTPQSLLHYDSPRSICRLLATILLAVLVFAILAKPSLSALPSSHVEAVAWPCIGLMLAELARMARATVVCRSHYSLGQ